MICHFFGFLDHSYFLDSYLKNSSHFLPRMDTIPLPRSRGQVDPSPRIPFHKAAQSQATIDRYLGPIVKAKLGQNDIRRYFPPVTGSTVAQGREVGRPSSPLKNAVVATQSTFDFDSTASNSDSRSYVHKASDILPRLPYHSHSNSAVLPRFDPFFDNEDFLHSTSPMAHRVTDVLRRSLLPKPLNIKMPPHPPAETCRSPSETTSSPSSLGDPDSASSDEETREAPCFKRTYMSVHSRQNTNDSPISPLNALRDPKPLRQRVDRPATLRSNTMPQLSGSDHVDSVIYFLPTFSPTYESSDDEREPLVRTRYAEQMDDVSSSRHRSKDWRQAARLDCVGPDEVNQRLDSPKEKTDKISPGL